MKLPAKSVSRVERLAAAIERASAYTADYCQIDIRPEQGLAILVTNGAIDLNILAADLFGPQPPAVPSTEAIAVAMDVFYADIVAEEGA